MADIAARVKEFFYDELYAPNPPKARIVENGKVREVFATMGFMIAGYSAGRHAAEVWLVEISRDGKPTVNCLFDTDTIGAEAKGQPEALTRLVNGWSMRVLDGLVSSGMQRRDAERFLRDLPMEPLVHPGMPIQDAIDLVFYFCEVTAGFVKFAPGAPTVHPPIDLASISYHEGFRWVRRKHYYSPTLNPQLLNI